MSVHVIGVDSEKRFRDFSVIHGTEEEVRAKLEELGFTILAINEFED